MLTSCVFKLEFCACHRYQQLYSVLKGYSISLTCFVTLYLCLVVVSQEKELAPPEEKFNRPALEDLVKRRFFYSVSFGIYGGKGGGM